MSWEQIKKVALLGTDRTRLPAALQQRLRQYLDPADSEPRQLLQGLVLFRQLQRAGQPYPLLEEAERAFAKSDPSRKAPARLLERLLYEGMQAVLPEALQLMHHHSVTIPNEFLPELMTWLQGHPQQQEDVRAVCDAQARFLVARHPQWKQFAVPTDESRWYHGRPDERRQWLYHLRQDDPEAALRYLEETWAQEHPQDKCLFLSLFRVPQLPAEARFLANALTDAHKDVRLMAAKMLVIRPDAEYRHTLFAKAREFLTWTEEKGLIVTAPAGQDDQLKALGIGYARKKLPPSEARRWVWTMVALLPPAFWETWTQGTTQATLRIFAEADDRPALLEALLAAAVLHRDERWMRSLLRLALQEEEELLTTHPGRKLIEGLPEHTFNEVLTEYLKHNPYAVLTDEPLKQALLSGSQPWEAELTRSVLQPFRRGLSEGSRLSGWEWENYQPVIEAMALRCPPAMLDELRHGWKQGVGSWGLWEKRIDRLLKTVHFRQGMHRYFATEYPANSHDI